MPRDARISGTTIYLSTGLLRWLDQEWPGMVTHVRTATDSKTGEVLLSRCGEKDKGAMELKRSATQNTATFSFWRPLQKLKLKVPEDRTFVVKPFTREITGLSEKVFVFPMDQRVSEPRDKKSKQEPRPEDDVAAAQEE